MDQLLALALVNEDLGRLLRHDRRCGLDRRRLVDLGGIGAALPPLEQGHWTHLSPPAWMLPPGLDHPGAAPAGDEGWAAQSEASTADPWDAGWGAAEGGAKGIGKGGGGEGRAPRPAPPLDHVLRYTTATQ